MPLPTTPVECSVEVGITELEFLNKNFESPTRIWGEGEYVDMLFLAKNIYTLFQASGANYIHCH